MPVSQVVVVYDGDCGLCVKWVNWLSQNLPVWPKTVASQSIDLDQWGLSTEDVRDFAWVLTPSIHLAGAGAFSFLLRHQPHLLWRFAGHLMNTWPFSWVAALGYLVISRNRHRLPGGTPQCEMPSS